MTAIMFLVLVCMFVINLYIIIRNDMVYKFRIELGDIGYFILTKYLDNIPTDDEETYNTCITECNKMRKVWISIMDIPYNKMLFSFKPLKPEYWLNKEQLEFLNYYWSF